MPENPFAPKIADLLLANSSIRKQPKRTTSPMRTLPTNGYVPQAILKNQSYKLYWDTTMNPDTDVIANIPDIVLVNKPDKISYLIDIAVPGNTHLQNK